MFEHYSVNAKDVLERARHEAIQLRHDHLGTEHILLGLIEVKNGFAAEVFRDRDVNLTEVKNKIKVMVLHGAGPEDGDYDKLPRTPHAQSVLDDAVQEARELKHGEIGTEHLLLGLLHENDGTGAKVLASIGLKLDSVREDILGYFQRDADK